MRAAPGPHVVIVGGGFAGLYAAQSLRRAPVRITLIDRRNFHLFQPLLYQVATGGLSPADIASPLRSILRRQRNVCVLQAEVTGFDAAGRRVLLGDASVEYDTLIVATGVSHHYFGRDDWEPLAPGLKSIEDATGIRRRVFEAFERAEREPDAARQQEWLTFAVVGGGPTGVELAGAIGELAHHTLPQDFCRIDTRQARVHLLEAGERILSTYDERLSRAAVASAERLGVTVRTGSVVTGIGPDGVTIGNGPRAEFIAARTVVWAAGVQASPLGAALAAATGAELDRQGRVIVGPDLAVPGHPGILVLGDLAHARQAGDRQPGGQPLPGLAPVAMQQGAYAGRLITRRLQGRETPPFRYRDRGSMAVIGRSAAVAQIRGLRLSGFAAWLAWLFIHLIYLVEFENRLLVLLQWGWSYVTRNRSARLITGTPKSRDSEPDGPGAES